VDRRTWLAERRASTIAEYDAEASGYEQDEYPVDAQIRFVARLLDTCPKDGLVLDAPCGTGKYFPLVAVIDRIDGDPKGRCSRPCSTRRSRLHRGSVPAPILAGRYEREASEDCASQRVA
jgi:hypothetical protein